MREQALEEAILAGALQGLQAMRVEFDEHSDARNVEVMLAGQGSEIQAAVRDDGRAWDSRRWESGQPRSAENWWSKVARFSLMEG